MFVPTVVVSVLLAIAFTASGAGKLAEAKQSLKFRDRLQLPRTLWRTIGALELAAVLGLLAGLAFAPLTVAAATGTFLLMAGAVAVHARARDLGKDIIPAVVLLLLSFAAIVLRLASS